MDIDDVSKLDKLGLHSVVYDLRAWLLRTESDLRYKAKQRAKVDDRDGRKECWEQAEGLALCRHKLDDLLNQLKSATKVVKRTAPIVVDDEPDTCVDDPSVYLPTPDEIAAKTAEIRSGWTESEQQRRHFLKNDETDFGKPTNFIF
jgi:hypothetical protein